MKNLLIIVLFCLLNACAYTPITGAGRYDYDSPYEKTVNNLKIYLKRCWEKNDIKHGFILADHYIYIIYKEIKSGTRFSLGRYHDNYGFIAFSNIYVNKFEPNTTQIVVDEGHVRPGLKYEVNASIKEWVSGNLDCPTIKK